VVRQFQLLGRKDFPFLFPPFPPDQSNQPTADHQDPDDPEPRSSSFFPFFFFHSVFLCTTSKSAVIGRRRENRAHGKNPLFSSSGWARQAKNAVPAAPAPGPFFFFSPSLPSTSTSRGLRFETKAGKGDRGRSFFFPPPSTSNISAAREVNKCGKHSKLRRHKIPFFFFFLPLPFLPSPG